MVQRTIPMTGKATIIVATILYAGRCDEVAAICEIGVYRRMWDMAVMSACDAPAGGSSSRSGLAAAAHRGWLNLATK
jgi:hypothetical protein